MGSIYTGPYECLELFAKSRKGKEGTVVVLKKNGAVKSYLAGSIQYRLLKISLEKETEYDVTLKDCEISICYLSERENILDWGVRFLESKEDSWIPISDLAKWYQTPGREQYHFCPYKNWINDPNGLCWYQGYYHMYYQANPHSQNWDQMYWGHAASKDCIHWVHLPYALQPQEELLNSEDKKGGAFSGSAVVLDDRIRFYLTRHIGPQVDSEEETRQYQTMVESKDSIHFGEEITIIEKPNADFSFDFRDPKVIWHDGCWQMVIGARVNQIPSIALYQSADGKDWNYHGILLQEKTEDIYTIECPDMYLLDGKLVLTGAWMFYPGEQRGFQPIYYYIETCGNERFQVEHKGLYDFAGNFYAVQSFEHAGRRIAIGWVSDVYKEHCPELNGANGSMTLPRELHIKDGILYQKPIEEVYRLKGKRYCSVSRQNISLKRLNGNSYYGKILFSLDTDFEILLGQEGDAQLKLVRKGTDLSIVTQGTKPHTVTCTASLGNLKKLEIFVDHRLVEVYANDGEKVGTRVFYQEKDGIFSAKFDAEDHVDTIELYEIKGIWG